MDFTKPIVYNGLTAEPPTPVAGTPLSGIHFKRARFSDVEGMGYNDKRALDDGLDATDVFMGGRVVLLDAAVYGSTEGVLWDNFGALIHAFDPVIAYEADTANRGFLPFRFYRPTADVASWPESTYPNGIPLQMNLRPIRTAYDIDAKRTGGTPELGGALPVSIQLIARDPRIYNTAQLSLSVSTASQTASSRGGHPSWPFVVFNVSGGAGPSAVRVATDGYSVRLDLSGETTGAFSLNYATRHITDSTGTSRDDLFEPNFDQQFRAVQPGGSVVNGFSLANLTITYAWREAWL